MKLSFLVFKNILYIASESASQKIILEEKIDRILFSAIKDFMCAHNIQSDDIKEVLTLGGPAPFTQLRIIISAAKGYAIGAGAKCCLIPSFDFFGSLFKGKDIIIALETRRGDYFGYDTATNIKGLMQKEEIVAGFQPKDSNPGPHMRSAGETSLRGEGKIIPKTKPLIFSDDPDLNTLNLHQDINFASALITYHEQNTASHSDQPCYLYTPEYRKI